MYSAYLNLATFFEQQHNYEKAVYFFERCHGIAQAAADLHGELEATLHLGAAHDALGDTAQVTPHPAALRQPTTKRCRPSGEGARLQQALGAGISHGEVDSGVVGTGVVWDVSALCAVVPPAGL